MSTCATYSAGNQKTLSFASRSDKLRQVFRPPEVLSYKPLGPTYCDNFENLKSELKIFSLIFFSRDFSARGHLFGNPCMNLTSEDLFFAPHQQKENSRKNYSDVDLTRDFLWYLQGDVRRVSYEQNFQHSMLGTCLSELLELMPKPCF